jgi:hypothetical protein
MIEWLQLTDKRKREIISQVNNKNGLAVKAIEKDWWVTLALKATFSTPWAANIVFKGGTSLSKSWNLIERFSEDVDLAIDRSVLGVGKITNGGQVKRLRRLSAEFIVNEFAPALKNTILTMGVDSKLFNLEIRPTGQPDVDPQILELQYNASIAPNDYIPDRILIEIGSRSLREPCSPRSITSIIGATFPGVSFSGAPFLVETVDPKRTFLEKIFLLHEMFQQQPDKWKHERLSRHPYDLYRLMNTEHGQAALADSELYNNIVEHRKQVTPIRGVDYTRHHPATINFIPPAEVLHLWAADYEVMRTTMIYGNPPEFKEMMGELSQLQRTIQAMR